MLIFHQKPMLRREAEDDAEGGGGNAAPDHNAQMAALQTQIDQLKAEKNEEKSRAAENETNARYWHEQAKASKVAPAAKVEPAEDEDEIDPIEAMSKNGSKGFRDLGKRSGFMTKDEVNNLVEARAQQLTVEAQLAKDFPQITDQSSEFFKATAKEYGELTAQGIPHLTAMKQAPRMAKLALMEAGKLMPAAEREEREQRSVAAGGDRSRGKGGKSSADEESDELTPLQRQICEQMGVDEKKYKSRAKDGVVYSGGNRF